MPLAVDLYCGLGGWAEGFLAEGYDVRGYDIEAHDYGTGGYPGELILADVLKLHGRECADAAVIVGSSPCTEYSYMAMPWSRAKQIAKALRGEGEFPEEYSGSHTIPELNALFNAQFRIQREASETAGRYIPMIVENVRGAQPWVGRAKANFGSYYLWGDVGMVGKRVVAGVPKFGVSVQPMKAVKTPGRSMSLDAEHKWGTHNMGPGDEMHAELAEAQKRNPDGTEHGPGSWFKIADSKNRGAHTKVPGISFNGEKGKTSPGFNVTAAQNYREGTKQSGISGARTNGKGGSKSDSRKAASAQIAKIPFPLASYIARTFKPGQSPNSSEIAPLNRS